MKDFSKRKGADTKRITGDMDSSKVFRKRIFPQECVCLKDDKILYFNDTEKRLVTSWAALKPRKDLHHGYSAYIYDLGFKISKFYNAENELNYWYFDIIDAEYPSEVATDQCKNLPDGPFDSKDCFVCTDLLADVIIYPDDTVKVVDLGELADMFEKEALSTDQLLLAIHRLDHLLSLIYSGKIQAYMDYLESFEA